MIIIFPAGHEDTAAHVVAEHLGIDVRLNTYATINLSTDILFVDVERPAAEGWLILKAPDPHTGDGPDQWIPLEGNQWANTTDLIAVRQATATEPTLEELRARDAAVLKYVEYVKARPQISAMHADYHRRHR